MMVFDLKFPELVLNSMSAVGYMNGPLSMIIVGAIFANVDIKSHLKDWTIYYGILMKMVLIPAILYLITIIIGDKSIVTNSIIILASMPSAAMTSIFAENFNFKRDYATMIMVLSTLISVLTIPALIRLIT